jgi:hypothetical protein
LAEGEESGDASGAAGIRRGLEAISMKTRAEIKREKAQAALDEMRKSVARRRKHIKPSTERIKLPDNCVDVTSQKSGTMFGLVGNPFPAPNKSQRKTS